MNARNIPYYSIAYIVYLVLQIFFFRHLILFNYAFCYMYIGCLLLLPFETSKTTLLFLGFIAGMIIDAFYNTMGIHAAAMVLIAYLRPNVIKLIAPQRGYDERMHLGLKSMGPIWFVTYISILTLIHHSVIFFLEASNIYLFFITLLKVILSTVFTCLVIYLFQFFRKE